MTRVTRTRTPTLDVEHRILAAATTLMAEEGPEALSIRRIAAAAEVAPMSVYNRFGSKSGVVDALFTVGFQRLDAALDIERTGDLEVDLLTCGRNYREFALANPTLYAVMFSRAVPDYEPSDEAMTAATRSFQHLVDHLVWHLANGRIDPTMGSDPVELAQRVWESIHGAVSLELAGIGFVTDHADHLDASARTLARGLAAAPGSVAPLDVASAVAVHPAKVPAKGGGAKAARPRTGRPGR